MAALRNGCGKVAPELCKIAVPGVVAGEVVGVPVGVAVGEGLAEGVGWLSCV